MSQYFFTTEEGQRCKVVRDGVNVKNEPWYKVLWQEAKGEPWQVYIVGTKEFLVLSDQDVEWASKGK